MAENTVPAVAQAPEESIRRQETTRAQEEYIAPPVDIYETDEGLTVVADLPGVSRDNLDIQVVNGILTIAGRTHHQQTGQQVYQEFRLVNFHRQFHLAETVDTARIRAELSNGVLTLLLPKAEAAKPRRIEVKTA